MSEKYCAVIDTETTWSDEVMSIGVVIADATTFECVDKRYYILNPEYRHGAMYSGALHIEKGIIATRREVMVMIQGLLERYQVSSVLAYNAGFDYKHLLELDYVSWYDIMKIAAYRQYNQKIPAYTEFCRSGRMKRNFGVESMTHILTGSARYRETHNAVRDAVDELAIMRYLGHPLTLYQENAVIYEIRKKEAGLDEKMSAKEAAESLGVSVSQVYALIKENVLQAKKEGRSYRISRISVDEYIKNNG